MGSRRREPCDRRSGASPYLGLSSVRRGRRRPLLRPRTRARPHRRQPAHVAADGALRPERRRQELAAARRRAAAAAQAASGRADRRQPRGSSRSSTPGTATPSAAVLRAVAPRRASPASPGRARRSTRRSPHGRARWTAILLLDPRPVRGVLPLPRRARTGCASELPRSRSRAPTSARDVLICAARGRARGLDRLRRSRAALFGNLLRLGPLSDRGRARGDRAPVERGSREPSRDARAGPGRRGAPPAASSVTAARAAARGVPAARRRASSRRTCNS